METTLIPTNKYYQEILSCADVSKRNERYLALFVEPWKQMMSAQFGASPDDPFSGPRSWSWLLPDQLEEMSVLLNKMESASAWQTAEKAMQKAASCFEPYAGQIPFDEFTGWLILANPLQTSANSFGYTGATDWFSPRFICQYWDPNPENLRHLGGAISHEMHHLIRNRIFPFGPQTSVADYIIVEGMAESFATSLYGEECLGRYVSDISAEDLQTSKQLMAKALNETGFDVIRGYIFGDEVARSSGAKVVGGMPAFGGYAVGYHVVQAYLKQSGRRVEEATFIPTKEIVDQSGYFD
jgi:uncharacterized protein YjaZ